MQLRVHLLVGILMEHSDVNPNLETESSETFSVADFQDGGGVDTNSIAGPSGTTESEEVLPIELEINHSIETTKLKNNNDNAKTFEVGNNSIIKTIIQDKESGKNRYICKFCSQTFNKHQALGGHMNGHSKEQRNLKKFEKVTTWIHETYPPPLHTTLASEAKQQGIPIERVTSNSYNHLVEVGNVYSELGGQRTSQQSTQQIQLSQGLPIQQRLQYYQSQEPQHYKYSQGLQSNQAPESLQSIQALQTPQNYQLLERLQNYQTPQRLQNHQASQGSQSYQTPQQIQNYQTPQELEYYQPPQGLQYHQIPQRFQNYQIPQGPQSYQSPQGFQSYQAPRGPQNYQTPHGSQTYQAPQGSQSYQTLQGQWQRLVVDANDQQNINLNPKMSNKSTSLAKVPSSEQKNSSSNPQGLHFKKEAQSRERYISNLHNLPNGDRLTTRPFINEQLNKDYYAQLRPNKLRRTDQVLNTPHNHDVVAQYRPTNPPNTSSSLKQSKDE